MKISNFIYTFFFISFFCFSLHAQKLMLDKANYESLNLAISKPGITKLVVQVPVSVEDVQNLKDIFPSVIHLKIMPNLISSDVFQELLTVFPNLKILDLSNNKIKQKDVPLFNMPMPNLKKVFISSIDDENNQIEPTDFKNLAEYAPHLELLDASFNHVNYYHAIELQHFKKLKILILRSTELEDMSIQFIKNLSEVNVLDLSCTRIHSFAVNFFIAKMSTLNELSLGYCSIGKAGIRNIVKNLKDLTDLSLPFTEVEDAEVLMILEGLPNLKRLDISKNCIREAGYDHLITAIKNQKYKLEKLRISPCKARFKTDLVEIEKAKLKTCALEESLEGSEILEIVLEDSE